MKPATGAMPLWQSALLVQGCQLKADDKFFSLELCPIGDRIICTPTMNGVMVPFNLEVTVGESVTITWDNELSRYLVTMGGRRVAA
jgi:hypothetical protein